MIFLFMRLWCDFSRCQSITELDIYGAPRLSIGCPRSAPDAALSLRNDRSIVTFSFVISSAGTDSSLGQELAKDREPATGTRRTLSWPARDVRLGTRNQDRRAQR